MNNWTYKIGKVTVIYIGQEPTRIDDNKYHPTVKETIKIINEMAEIPEGRDIYLKAVENELLRVLKKRNIKTINQVGTNHLMMVILNLSKRYGNDKIQIFKLWSEGIFNSAVTLGFITSDNNPAVFLDNVFPDKPMEIICDVNF